MMHQTSTFQLLSVAFVLPFVVQAVSSGGSLSQGSPAVRDVSQADEASALSANRGPYDVLHDVRDGLPLAERLESWIESSTTHQIEKRKKRPSGGSNNDTNSTEDADESGASRSTFTMHASLALSFAALLGFLQI